jgi:hypothetical protein
MRATFYCTIAMLAGCNQAPSGFVSCLDGKGVETKTSTEAEWLFIDGVWLGYAEKGEARAFPSASYRPSPSSVCKFVRTPEQAE